MELYEKTFDMTIFIQSFLFIFFIMDNLYNLEDVNYNVTVGDSITNYSFNFYTMMVIIIVIVIAAILVGINIFGSGFNESSSILMRKYMGIAGLISILFICSNYYLLQLGLYGITIDLFFTASYSFKFINLLTEGN